MNYNQRVGKFGETLAKDYLVRRGYKIIGTNVKISYQELDIVARKDDLIVFIEVKTRVSQAYGLAEDAFVRQKSERLKRGIEMYLGNNEIEANDIRADLITVDLDSRKKVARIKHYQDII